MAVPIVEATMALRNCASCSVADKLPYVVVVIGFPPAFLLGLHLQRPYAAAATCLYKCCVKTELLSFRPMSAFGPKQTWRIALHMSAFGGKADIDCSQYGVTYYREHGLQREKRRNPRQHHADAT